MLIFIHGFWANGSIWRPFIEYFSKRNFDCVAIDLREGLDMRKASFKDYVNKVRAIARKDDIIIGHSMGGLIVQKVAEEIIIKGGIAICPAPPKGIKFGKRMLLSSIKYLPKVIINKPFKTSFSFAKKFFLNCVEDARSVYKKLEVEPANIAYELMMSKIEVDERKVKCPLLFIATKDDKACKPEMVKRIAEKYDAEFIIEEGCHWIFDNWQSIADKIQSFIVRLYEDKLT